MSLHLTESKEYMIEHLNNMDVAWKQYASFENGATTPNPTSFDSVVGANLTVTEASKYRDTYGAQVLLEATKNHYGQFNGASGFRRITIRWYFNKNNLAMAVGDGFRHLTLESTGGAVSRAIDFQVSNIGGTVSFKATTFNDAGGQTNDAFAIPTGWNEIELAWAAATGAATNDGVVACKLNGAAAFTSRTNIDNNDYTLAALRFGGHQGVDAGTSGTLYFDNIGYRRT